MLGGGPGGGGGAPNCIAGPCGGGGCWPGMKVCVARGPGTGDVAPPSWKDGPA
jgi:hypothetical protein